MKFLSTLRLAIYLWLVMGYSWGAAWGEAEETFDR
jgi:hypothetical protein